MIKNRSRLATIFAQCLIFTALAGLVTVSYVKNQPKGSTEHHYDFFGGSQIFNVYDYLISSYHPEGYDPNKVDVITHSGLTH
ncbi:hypothetical protein ABIE60_002133 [Marinobacterium sp. MBR-109]|jgi:hypothetical protein